MGRCLVVTTHDGTYFATSIVANDRHVFAKDLTNDVEFELTPAVQDVPSYATAHEHEEPRMGTGKGRQALFGGLTCADEQIAP